MKSYNCSEANYILINSQQLDTFTGKTKPAKRNAIKLPDFQQLWDSILAVFANSSEPRIYQRYDRYGNLYFKVYDPIAQQSSTFTSEQEVRVWLDQRYYQ